MTYPFTTDPNECIRYNIKDSHATIAIHIHGRKARVVLLKRPRVRYRNLTSLWQNLCAQADENGWVVHYHIPDHEKDPAVWVVLRELGFVETPTDDERYLFRPARKNHT